MAEMKITDMKIEDLIPYENNPRRNDEAVDMVMDSIDEFGFQNPIIVDKNNVIISGHTRYKAALNLGLEIVPVEIADDMTEEQARAFRLADNRVAELAAWNLDKLMQEMTELAGEEKKELSKKAKEKETKHQCPRCGHRW